MQIKHNNSLGFKFWDDESSINFQPSSFSTFLLFHMYKQLSLITIHAKFQLHRYAALWHPPLQFLPRLPRKRLPDSEIYYRNIETVCINKFMDKLSSLSKTNRKPFNCNTNQLVNKENGRILYFDFFTSLEFSTFPSFIFLSY